MKAKCIFFLFTIGTFGRGLTYNTIDSLLLIIFNRITNSSSYSWFCTAKNALVNGCRNHVIETFTSDEENDTDFTELME